MISRKGGRKKWSSICEIAMYLVEVKGNVIIEGGNQRSGETILLDGRPLTQEEIELLPKDYSPLSFNSKKRVVEGNLFLSEKRRYIPYATYLIHGDELFDERAKSGVSWIGDGVEASYLYWEESIKKMEDEAHAEIPSFCADTFYNGLFVGCFSALELLLCNIVFSLIYSNQSYFDRSVEYWSRRKENPPKTNEEMETIIHDFFARRVYHRFNTINAMFRRVFDFSLPDYKELTGFIHKRHNIVHRHSISNLDWMTITDASKEDVLSLIRCTKTFAAELKKRASGLLESHS